MAEVALGAAALAAHQPHRLELVEKIGRRLADVQHPIDGLARGSLAGRHQRQVLVLEREIVGDADGGDARRQQRLVGDALDALAVDEYARPVAAQQLPVVGGRHQHVALLRARAAFPRPNGLPQLPRGTSRRACRERGLPVRCGTAAADDKDRRSALGVCPDRRPSPHAGAGGRHAEWGSTTTMAKQREMILIGFLQAQNCSNYVGSWRHPHSATDFLGPEYFLRIARTLEYGKFHLGFFDDRLAMPDILGSDHREAVANGVRVVKMDPTTILACMGMATTQPRARLDLFDDLLRAVPRRARVRDARPDDAAAAAPGTSSRRSITPKPTNLSQAEHPEHDLRYDKADEFMEVVHGHWDSWEDDAIVIDKESGLFAHPEKVHRLDHKGSGSAPKGPLHGAAQQAGPPGRHPGRTVGARPEVLGALGRARVLRLPEHRHRQEELCHLQGSRHGLRPRSRRGRRGAGDLLPWSARPRPWPRTRWR